MPNKLILKRSSVAAKVPLSTDLEIGELAVNLTDKKLFTKDSGGTVIELGGGGASLPSQTGNSGKFLTTNGTAASWGDVAFSAVTGKPTTISGYGITDATPSSHVGSGGTQHANASTSVAGFMSAADKTKLDGIATGATANLGTVTSVGLSLPSILTVSGSPVTTSGTLSATLASQTANTVLAAPNGSAGAPTFRALVAADIPTLNQNTTGSAGSVPFSGVTSKPTTLAGYGITDAVTAGAGGAIIENSQTITANYTLTAGRNGMSAGIVTINSGVTVTIPAGASWAIV